MSRSRLSLTFPLKGLGGDGSMSGQIFMMLVPSHFQKAEYIYKVREVGGEMYFVTAGIVFLYNGSGITKNLPTDAIQETIYRPQELAKTRKVERNCPEPYLGHISLFHEVCKVRPEDARTMTNVETLCLTREAVDSIRSFCPDFYQSLFDLSLLSASRYGVSNESVLSTGNRTGGVSKIDQICFDLRKEFMGRHKRILLAKSENEWKPKDNDLQDGLEIITRNGNDLHLTRVHSSSTRSLAAVHPTTALKHTIIECDMLVDDNCKFMHSLPSSPGKDSAHLWKRGILSITRDLEVWYILDEVGHLIESHPKLLGTLVVNAQDSGKACQLWRQAVDKSSG